MRRKIAPLKIACIKARPNNFYPQFHVALKQEVHIVHVQERVGPLINRDDTIKREEKINGFQGVLLVRLKSRQAGKVAPHVIYRAGATLLWSMYSVKSDENRHPFQDMGASQSAHGVLEGHNSSVNRRSIVSRSNATPEAWHLRHLGSEIKAW